MLRNFRNVTLAAQYILQVYVLNLLHLHDAHQARCGHTIKVVRHTCKGANQNARRILDIYIAIRKYM